MFCGILMSNRCESEFWANTNLRDSAFGVPSPLSLCSLFQGQPHALPSLLPLNAVLEGYILTSLFPSLSYLPPIQLLIQFCGF